MKLFFICLLLAAGCHALAQSSEKSNLNTEIDDNGKTYSIRIDGKRKGQAIHYDRTFDVAGMSNDQKEGLKNRVLDSLGLGEIPPPPPSGMDTKQSSVKVRFNCPTCAGKTKLSISGEGFSAEREVDLDKRKSGFPFEMDMMPGEYRYQYRQDKVLQMQQPFTVKAGQENTVTVK